MENQENSAVITTQTETNDINNNVNNNLNNDNLNNQNTENNFVIPEEYQDKAWAKNIKSQEELFKSYDNAQSLIGKKTIGIPDFDKASDEEIKSFYDKIAPKDIKDYDLDGIEESQKEFYGNLFKENGLNKRQAKNIVEKFNETMNDFFSEDGFDKELKDRFGDDYEKVLNDNRAFLNRYLDDKDKKVIGKMPNAVLGMMISFSNNLKKEYGIETKNNIDSPNSTQRYSANDYQARVSELMKDYYSKKISDSQLNKELQNLQEFSKNIKW